MVRTQFGTLLLVWGLILCSASSYAQTCEKIQPCFSINTPHEDLALGWFNGELLFSTSMLSNELSDLSGGYVEEARVISCDFAPGFDSLYNCKSWAYHEVLGRGLNTLTFSHLHQQLVFSGGKEAMKGIKKGKSLLTCTIDKEKEMAVEVLLYEEDVLTMHPSFSEEGDQLFFASDRPGGKGGLDLYYINRSDSSWSQPIPLTHLNTTANEAFPQWHDSKLYFSSDREGGFGGLDLYVSSKRSQWKDMEHMDSLVNSSSDDFNIIWLDSERAYMSSNRLGGGSKDDVFLLHFVDENKQQRDLSMRAVCNGESIPFAQMKMINSAGRVLFEGKADASGLWVLEGVTLNEKYTVEVTTGDDEIDACLELELLDESGDVFARIKRNADGKFVFELLPFEDFPLLIAPKPDDSSFLLLDFGGQIVHEDSTTIEESEPVYILGEDGQILALAYTHADGAFNLHGLSPQEEYMFQLSPKSKATSIRLIDGDEEVSVELDESKRGVYTRIEAGEGVSIIDGNKEEITVRKDELFVISDLRYDFGSDQLRATDHPVLDRIVVMLQLNPRLKISLTAHTDNRGKSEFNKRLSEQRALNCAIYMIGAGVTPSRILTFGRGEDEPLEKCEGRECTEEEHQKNRRTELRILFD